MAPDVNGDLRRELDKKMLSALEDISAIKTTTESTNILCEKLDKKIDRENQRQWLAIDKNTTITRVTKWLGAILLTGSGGSVYGFWGELKAFAERLLAGR